LAKDGGPGGWLMAKENLRFDESVFSAGQGKAAGLSYMSLSRLVKSGDLQRPVRGIYKVPNEPDDRLYVEQLRRPKIVYSHATALYLHDLIPTQPVSLSVTVPTGYNTKTLSKEDFTVFSVKNDLYKNDIIQLSTNLGHSVNVYSRDRTIVDCIRSRNRMDLEVFGLGLTNYVIRLGYNMLLLDEISKKFAIANLVNKYITFLFGERFIRVKNKQMV
jgi:hypothetical protein